MIEFLEQIKHLLVQAAEHPELSLQSYSLVTPSARLQLPNPQIEMPEPWHEPITTHFASWMGRTAEQTAVCEGEYSWTYTELAKAAHALAHALVVHGVEKGNIVAVTGGRSFGLIASMVGVLLSGGVLLNLDPSLPHHQRQLMLEESRARHLLFIGDPGPTDEWMTEAVTLICVDPDSGQALHFDKLIPPEGLDLPQVTPEDAAYLFFTSGSTGVPKGVIGCHKGLSHFLNWQRQTFAIGSSDRSAQLTGLSFDVVLRDVFTPLSSGATLCLPPEPGMLDPERLLSWMERERISMLHTVPSLAQSWLPYVPPGISLGALRWVFFAGEPLTDTLVRRWRKTFPASGEIVNLYGPTETTLAKCYFCVPSEPLPGVQPVGSPLPETQALILGENGQLCGISEPGQIVLRTPFRSLGYINASEENRRRFVENPFRNDEKDVLYHTGDLGRYRPDGTVDILGRVDHQVKLRGVRIELEGIETVLVQHPAVWEAVALVREDVPGHQRLVAYVTARPGCTLTTHELRRLLKQKLPSFMIPSAFLVLDALPLTSNGKVNRRALPAPEGLRPELEEDYVAPRTELERAIADIWQEALHVGETGIDDNFFDLGGHSLLLIQVQYRLGELLGRDVSVVELFEYPTISSLAQHLSQEQSERPSLHKVQERSQIRRGLMRQRRQSRNRL
jgi:amino acid adenylation domain-containing protein